MHSKRPPIILVNRCLIVDGRGRILLIRRRPDDPHNPGLWEVPGGKTELGQNIREALDAEVMQKTGLVFELTTEQVLVESKFLADGRYAGHLYVSHFHLGRLYGGRIRLTEHHQYAWAGPRKALDYDLTDETRTAIIRLRPQLDQLSRSLD